MNNTARCKTCNELGYPVKGMTAKCPICAELFCFGHLNNHTHKFADLRSLKSKESLRASGFGRVGSYAKAKQSGRCRARKYWAIVYFDHRDYTDTFGMIIHKHCEVANSPHFKTKNEGENWLNKYLGGS